jgi:hypothetical protein
METAIDVEEMTPEQLRIAELEAEVYRLAGIPEKAEEFELARKKLEQAKLDAR